MDTWGSFICCSNINILCLYTISKELNLTEHVAVENNQPQDDVMRVSFLLCQTNLSTTIVLGLIISGVFF